jgi:polysaccharide export outer membrane protein
MNRLARLVFPVLVVIGGASAQTRVTPSAAQPAKSSGAATALPAAAPTSTPTSAAPPGGPLTPPTDYVLGPGDQLHIDIPDLADEFTGDKTFRVDGGGDLGLPLAGHVQAGGMTVGQLEEAIKGQLKRILKEPDVIVTITGFGSQPVSVLGAVKTPGIVQIAGHKNLFEVLSLAGGLAPDAGYQVMITREMKWGPLPLADAHTDPSSQVSVGSVKVRDIMSSSNTAENIVILPNDKISVPVSDLVYAVGNLVKPGGFLLNQHESLSAMQVVSLAEGFNKTAAPDRARILRVMPGSPNRLEIAVNLKQLMAGKASDVQLQPQDILFVPNSAGKSAAFRTLDVMTAASGALIYTTAH